MTPDADGRLPMGTATSTPRRPNYVSPCQLPDAYERELLDVLQEEAIEVAELAAKIAAKADAATYLLLAGEVGDMLKAAQLASAAGLMGDVQRVPQETHEPTTTGPVDERAVATTLWRASLALAKRCSKARRFGCGEREPSQPYDNATRVGAAWRTAHEAAMAMAGAGLLAVEDVEAGRLHKGRQLDRFMQHEPGGRRREQDQT